MTEQLHQQSLGEMLINKGVISTDQLCIAVQTQHNTHQSLGALLVQLGFLSENQLRDVLSENLGQTSVDLTTFSIDSAVIALIPQDWARRYHVLPLSLNQRVLTLAITDPDNIITLDQLRALLHEEYHLVTQLASESDILHALDQYYGYASSIDGILQEIEPSEGETTFQSLPSGINEFSQPVVRLINALLSEAVQNGASDIHFEPEQNHLRLRYRIDGVMRQMRSLHKSLWPAMVVRLKVMCGMNIAETRAPQDGRISLRLSARQIDFRVASHPTTHGENFVLRILDRQKGIVPLAQIGLDESSLNTLKLMIAKPEGIVLVTGPTGSGKTTTLYSVLNHLNSESVNIMTLEDPVEYPTSLMRQTSINETAKLDFASGIRSMMRQDPDIILVGEIRDHATAEMAFRAAMTGHQVFSTLHSNSALGAIPRLLDIGILPDIMAGNIIGIIAQRLVRVLCKLCKTPYTPDTGERRLLGIATHQDITLFHANGCPACQHQGYQGRIAIMELLKINYALDELISHHASTRKIRELALAQGFSPLAKDGIRLIEQGITSFAEVSRVLDLSDWMN